MFQLKGSKIRNNALPSPEIICCTQVLELKRIIQDASSISIGSAVTFAQMEEFLNGVLKDMKGIYKLLFLTYVNSRLNFGVLSSKFLLGQSTETCNL